MGCVSKAAHERFVADCKKQLPFHPSCAQATARVCPEGSPPITIEPGKISVTVLPLAQMCGGGSMRLAPYPPNKQSGVELLGEERVKRQEAELQRQGMLILRYEGRASKSLKPKFGWGFWAGIGLTGIGIALSVAKR